MNFADAPEPCASATACAADSLARSFSPPIRIDDGTDCTIRTVRALFPNANGSGVIAWNSLDPNRMRARRVTAAGAWSAVEPAGNAWGSRFDVAMTAIGDALIVGARADRVAASLSIGGTAWAGIADLGGPHDAEGSISVTTHPGGPALAAWTQWPSAGAYATWTAAGGWTAPTALSAPFNSAAIAPTPGGGFAMARISGGFIDLYHYSPTAGWGLGVPIGGFAAATDGARSAVNIAADGAGNIHVVWTVPGSNGQPSYIYYRERRPNGTWDPINRTIDTDVDTRRQPLIAASQDDDVVVVYASANSTRPRHTLRLREGVAWQEARPLNFQTTPAVAMDDTGNALLVWARDDSAFGLVQASRYFANVGWESAYVVTIHPGVTGATSPAVAAAMSPTGKAVISYIVRRPGEADRVYAHTLR